MPRPAEEPRLIPPVSEERDHVRGPNPHAVELVEFGDYECPYCGQAFYILHDVLEDLGDDVRFVFRHFPLTQLHPHAEKAAEAAEAAGAQGKFWEMHRALYEHQDQLDGPGLLALARSIGLDLNLFVTHLVGNVHAVRVREDFLSGVRSGVNGTPTFFIEGRRLDGPWDRGSLVAVIQAAIERRPRAAAGGRAKEAKE